MRCPQGVNVVVCKKCGCICYRPLCRKKKDNMNLHIETPICPACRKELE